ncbi:MAG: SH3 domain-containing protein [Oscillibacter sp.]|nr:SH3 domain-containing protein [Oscillibacter sp.]
MPIVYLSPSTQDWNPYVTGSGSEEYWMNRVADAMEPYLRANGIRYKRNDPETSAAAAIRDANGGYYDFYLALHSNASGGGEAQAVRGILAFYYPTSAAGKRGAELIAKRLAEIYPLPEKVAIRETTALGEVSRPRFPSTLVEIGYHDNYSDALWVEGHVEAIARQLTLALTDYFALPFTEPIPPAEGTVRLSYGTLNLRAAPSQIAAVIANLPNGASVTVVGEWQGWYVTEYDGQVGYAAAAFIDV